MSTNRYFLCVIVFLAACGGLNKDKPADAKPPQQTAAAAGGDDTLTYTLVNFRKESNLISRTDTSTDTTYVNIRYPQFKSEPVNNFVKKVLLISDNPDVQAGTVEELAGAFISNYDKFAGSQKGYSFPWEKTIDFIPVKQWPGMITFSKTQYEFAGGAHGNYGTFYYNYNTRTDSVIKLDDLIDATNRQKLTAVAERSFRRQENLADTASLKNGYFFEKGKFALNQNFLIQQDGLLFFYNPYEIKPYAAGTTRLFIPYTAINNILKKDAIIPKQNN